MAEPLSTYEFRGRGRPTRYPWDQWFDGRIWRLTPDDFAGTTPIKFRQAALSAASRRRLPVKTRIEGDTVVMQATPRPSALGAVSEQ